MEEVVDDERCVIIMYYDCAHKHFSIVRAFQFSAFCSAVSFISFGSARLKRGRGRGGGREVTCNGKIKNKGLLLNWAINKPPPTRITSVQMTQAVSCLRLSLPIAGKLNPKTKTLHDGSREQTWFCVCVCAKLKCTAQWSRFGWTGKGNREKNDNKRKEQKAKSKFGIIKGILWAKNVMKRIYVCVFYIISWHPFTARLALFTFSLFSSHSGWAGLDSTCLLMDEHFFAVFRWVLVCIIAEHSQANECEKHQVRSV